MIVNGHARQRTLLARQMTAWGAVVTEASTAQLAMELLHSAAVGGEGFYLALLNSVLPDVDSNDLIARIKADQTISGTHLILCTPCGKWGPAEHRQLAGRAECVSKPLRPSYLSECVQNVLAAGDRGRSNGPSPSGVRIIRHSSQNLGRILVVEDNSVNQRMAIRMLERLGYRADAVGNGFEAVDAITHIPYTAVFMDCQMPEMDGFEATRRIRQLEAGSGPRDEESGLNAQPSASHPRLRHIPIIAMTANALEGDRERCLAAGMNDYLPKPVKSEDLRAVLQRVFQRSRP